ncbi:hypothetical protein L1887_03231 [Cichorium endivia]|nr:hypothetical protein L1887_03231 [Cichorium endivia]
MRYGSNRGEPRGNEPAKNGALSKPLPIETPTISLNALNTITDNFGTKSFVGEGSYGRVFYGKLSAREEAAVKKLDTSSSPEPDNDFTGQPYSYLFKKVQKTDQGRRIWGSCWLISRLCPQLLFRYVYFCHLALLFFGCE